MTDAIQGTNAEWSKAILTLDLRKYLQQMMPRKRSFQTESQQLLWNELQCNWYHKKNRDNPGLLNGVRF